MAISEGITAGGVLGVVSGGQGGPLGIKGIVQDALRGQVVAPHGISFGSLVTGLGGVPLILLERVVLVEPVIAGGEVVVVAATARSHVDRAVARGAGDARAGIAVAGVDGGGGQLLGLVWHKVPRVVLIDRNCLGLFIFYFDIHLERCQGLRLEVRTQVKLFLSFAFVYHIIPVMVQTQLDGLGDRAWSRWTSESVPARAVGTWS